MYVKRKFFSIPHSVRVSYKKCMKKRNNSFDSMWIGKKRKIFAYFDVFFQHMRSIQGTRRWRLFSNTDMAVYFLFENRLFLIRMLFTFYTFHEKKLTSKKSFFQFSRIDLIARWFSFALASLNFGHSYMAGCISACDNILSINALYII